MSRSGGAGGGGRGLPVGSVARRPRGGGRGAYERGGVVTSEGRGLAEGAGLSTDSGAARVGGA